MAHLFLKLGLAMEDSGPRRLFFCPSCESDFKVGVELNVLKDI